MSRWGLVVLGLGACALLAGLQWLILVTPTDLVSSHPRGSQGRLSYRLSGPDARRRYYLHLYGGSTRTSSPRPFLDRLPVSATPVRLPETITGRARSESTILVIPKARRGTYKIALPGYRPFDLVNVAR